jgi:LssY C-terminus
MLSHRFALTLRRALLVVAAAGIPGPLYLYAQQASIVKLAIEKKPGSPDGRALAIVKGPSKIKGKIVVTEKTGRIATHAIQAWTIMNGQGALLLLSPERKGLPNRLRYYQLDAGKGRLLGNVPLDQGTVAERMPADDQWVFALSGTDSVTKKRVIYAGDTRAILALVDNGWDPHFSNDALSYESQAGKRTISIAELVALHYQDGIYAPARRSAEAAYLEFLPAGEALTIAANGEVDRGHWIKAASNFQVTSSRGVLATWPEAELHPVAGIPADNKITLRLLQPLSSLTAKEGMAVKAVSITPALDRGSILIPQGTEFSGKIVQAHGVGWGVKHESAALTLHFDNARLADGRTIAVDALVFKVENAQETVTATGKIQGIRSTGTLGNSAENKISSLAQIDPVAYLFLGASGPAVLGFAEPEIRYNAGTDLTIVFHTPVITSQTYPPNVPRMDLSAQRQEDFDAMVKALPFRTKTQGTDRVSDITNLIFVGKPDALRRAFDAAGWVPSDQLNAASTFQTVKTLAGNERYTQAPMSTLLLNDQQPRFTLSKTTNTFSSRHHIRVFPTSETWEGSPVMTASSTQDIGIAFSAKQKTFIHVIDQYLDNERSKVTNDLEFTGCVESIDLVPRPWVPLDAYNSTGDRLRTDGRATVLFLNDCANPRTTPTIPAERAGLFERGERNTMLTIKDQLFRGNVVYQGISTGQKVHHYLATSGELPQDEGNWRKSDASGAEYRLAGSGPHLGRRTGMWSSAPTERSEALDADARARILSHKWDPPRFEIALNLGYSKYRNNFLETTIVSLDSSKDEPDYLIGLGDAVFDGWAAGVSLTLNTNNWISSEFSYMRQQTKFDLVELTISSTSNPTDDSNDSQDYRIVGLVTRRAAYNTVLNFRPRRSRWRPYIDAGPVFQLLALSDAPLKKPSGYFRLGLTNIGLIKAAFDFGNTPPLDGGGVFQLGVQYGGGIKYRVTPRLTMRADFGETFTQNPKIIRDSYLGYVPDDLDDSYTGEVNNTAPSAKFVQQRATVGFAFTF